jgi:hypothetical protein
MKARVVLSLTLPTIPLPQERKSRIKKGVGALGSRRTASDAPTMGFLGIITS